MSFNDLVGAGGSMLEGYGEFLKETFTGDQNIVAKINGHSFRLTTIGIPPLKRGSVMSNVGCLEGSVKDTASGSRMTASFQLLPVFAMLRICSALFASLLIVVVSVLLIVGAQFEGIIAVWLGACIMTFVSSYFFLYITFGVKSQKKITEEFLARFSSQIKAAVPEPSSTGNASYVAN